MKFNLKGFLIGAWDVLAFFCYLQFVFMCFTGFVLILVISVFVLSEAGADTLELSRVIPTVIYVNLGYIAIMLINKVANYFRYDRN